jgi:hypothetical protein
VLRRLEIREIPVICEWDEETGHVVVGMGGERERAWMMMQALHDALLRETGAEWVDAELRERIFTGRQRSCLGLTSAVVWGADFTPAGSVEYVPKLIAMAAGVVEPELEP